MDDFDELLDQSKGLVSHIGAPVLIKGLAGLRAVSERLVRRHPPADPSKAQLLLAVDKVDLSKHSRNFRSIDISTAYDAHGEPLTALDLDKDLARRQQLVVNTTIEDSNRQTERSFRNHYVNKIEHDWELEKRRILDRLGWNSGSSMRTPHRTPARERVSASPAPLRTNIRGQDEGVTMGLEQQRYAGVVELLNYYRKGHRSHQITTCFNKQPVVVNAFKKVAADVEQATRQQDGEIGPMEDCWRLLRELIARENCGEKCYEEEYKSGSLGLQKELVRRSIRYLEIEYAAFVKQLTRGTARMNHTGTHNNSAWVRKYLDVNQLEQINRFRLQMLDGFPLWHQVFVAFRCGFLDECGDMIRRATKHASPKLSHELADPFIHCLQDYASTGQIQDEFRHSLTEAAQRHKADDDYAALMCSILGRRDTHDSSLNKLMKTSSQDFLWFQLHRLVVDSKSNDKGSLSNLQLRIRKDGEKIHNRAGNNPLLYFKLLLLSQQFEHAIHYLVRTNCFLLGVHAAVVLDYYGLLLRDDHQQGLLQESVSGGQALPRPRLNLLQIIRKTIEKPFMFQYPEAAFHYLFLLSRVPLEQDLEGHTRTVVPALVELILATKQYEQLIGSLNPIHPARVDDGKMGCVYRFFDKKDARDIIAKAANKANQDEGNVYDAIKLFQLAERNEETGEMLVKQFSRFVAMTPENQNREQLRKKLEYFLDQENNSSGPRLSVGVKEALIHLVKLARFFNLYHSGPQNYEQALNLMTELPFFSFLNKESYEQPIRQLKNMDSSVVRIIEKAAVAAMDIYLRLYQQIHREIGYQSYGGRNQVRLDMLKYLRAAAGRLVRAVSDSFPSALPKVVSLENQMI